MIYILTGPIGSGKTTQLENWIAKKESVSGILMPVLGGERHLYSIHSDKLVPVEIHDEISSDEVVKIGKYNFSGKVFDWGNKEIIACFEENNTIIIDEIGPIELAGKGFAPSLNYVLGDKIRLHKIDLILVVREGLLEQVTENFKIGDASILTDISGIKL